MKKIITTLVCLVFSTVAFSQKMITRSGEIKFEATFPGALDEIAGTNSTVSCIFDKATGEIATVALIKSFKFKSPLMEEHFNENYMESDKFPKSSFKGKVLGYDASKAGSYEVEGDMTIHGVTKKVKTKMTLSNVGGKLVVSGNFSVKLQDYDIKIPSMVKNKLSDTVKIAVKLELENK